MNPENTANMQDGEKVLKYRNSQLELPSPQVQLTLLRAGGELLPKLRHTQDSVHNGSVSPLVIHHLMPLINPPRIRAIKVGVA